jgi:hypothetical protein
MDATKKEKKAGKWKQQRQAAGVVRGTEIARRTASAILEVVSGERGSYEAAEALGISPMRYYALEGRALQGMVTALEPRPRGPRGPKPEDVLRKTEAERDRLRREVGRLESLLRVMRKGYRLEEPKATVKGKTKRRPKRATRTKVLLSRLRTIPSGETAASTPPADGGGEA